jgi:hypothetical protein
MTNLPFMLEAGLNAINYRRRSRRLSEWHVHDVILAARTYGLGYVRGGVISANSYGYPATTAAVAAVEKDGRLFVKFGTARANAGASPVTWFGPQSSYSRHLEQWRDEQTPDSLLRNAWIEVKDELAEDCAEPSHHIISLEGDI